MCGGAEETENHLFFACEFSRVLWYCCSLQIDITAIIGRDFHETWKGLCMRFHEDDRKDELLQECVFIMWRIWKNRNEMVFHEVLNDPMDMVHLVRKQLLEFRVCTSVENHESGGSDAVAGAVFAGQPVRWKRPGFWVIKVNCDGAWCSKTCKGGYGWVMRDFAGLLSVAGGGGGEEGGLLFNTVAMVEAAAIRAALLVCLELGYEEAEIESDSQVIISMINGNYVVGATLECYIHDIGQLVSQFRGVRFGFVKRNGNAAAHAIASYVDSLGGAFHVGNYIL
ncbi:uncharacterized protein LOC126602841 [Malus sylvestris]|uniref:uncharacterized protein LOC126602841 n=1 Tax=Malus sylvestris TaxID=3752 RepID=UPI0021AC2527|nr:uncharacterized protein LOC126602841 [Malus sylvestris]